MRNQRAAGFTLVEMLVVLVIIGVMIAGAVLAIGVAGRDRALETEANRFAALIDFAREQAELQSRELGVRMTAAGYTFVAFDAFSNEWAEIGDDALRARTLPDGLRFDLTLEGRRVVLKESAEGLSLAPQIGVQSSGDLTPFSLEIARIGTQSRIIVSTDEQGEVAAGKLSEGAP